MNDFLDGIHTIFDEKFKPLDGYGSKVTHPTSTETASGDLKQLDPPLHKTEKSQEYS